MSVKFDYILNKLLLSVDVSPLECRCVTFVNPISIFQLINLDCSVLEEFDAFYSDGFLIASLFRIFRVGELRRYSMDLTSLLPMFEDWDGVRKIGLLGATSEDLDRSILCLNARQSCEFIAISHGYIDFDDPDVFSRLINTIVDSGVDVLLVGLGSGLQERIAVLVANEVDKVRVFTCGAFITQTSTSGAYGYYPDWINRLNLRWVYRLCFEPHTRSRILTIFPFIRKFFLFLVRRIFRKYEI